MPRFFYGHSKNHPLESGKRRKSGGKSADINVTTGMVLTYARRIGFGCSFYAVKNRDLLHPTGTESIIGSIVTMRYNSE